MEWQGLAQPQEQSKGLSGLMDQAQEQYPILKGLGLSYKYSPGRAPGYLEFWPGDETGTPDYPRPSEFPMGKAGVEVFDPRTRPIDVLGDALSHHLIYTDPVIKEYYRQFQGSLEPWQMDHLQRQYKTAQEKEGEKRPYKQWEEWSGLPGYFRGYPIQQWDFASEMYTPEQLNMLDQMMEYVRSAK